MVSIVIPEKSLVDIINAGLTKKYYNEENKEPRIYLVNKEEAEIFWKDIKNYIDERDSLLYILNFPLASEETLKSISLTPYEQVVIYVPSKLIDVTQKSNKILLEKGITSMPPREPYKCFPGEYNSEFEKKWMEIGELLSSEHEGKWISKETNETIFELIETAKKDPYLAIDKIANEEL